MKYVIVPNVKKRLVILFHMSKHNRLWSNKNSSADYCLRNLFRIKKRMAYLGCKSF